MQLLRSLSALVVINIIITTMSASIVELKLTYNTDKNVINSSNNTKYIDRQHLYTVSRKKVPPQICLNFIRNTELYLIII